MRFKIDLTPQDVNAMPDRIRAQITAQLPAEIQKSHARCDRVMEQVAAERARLQDWSGYLGAVAPIELPVVESMDDFERISSRRRDRAKY